MITVYVRTLVQKDNQAVLRHLLQILYLDLDRIDVIIVEP